MKMCAISLVHQTMANWRTTESWESCLKKSAPFVKQSRPKKLGVDMIGSRNIKTHKCRLRVKTRFSRGMERAEGPWRIAALFS